MPATTQTRSRGWEGPGGGGGAPRRAGARSYEDGVGLAVGGSATCQKWPEAWGYSFVST